MRSFKFKNKRKLQKKPKKPLSRKQFEKELIHIMFWIMLFSIISFAFYFDFLELPKPKEINDYRIEQSVFNKYVTTKSLDINIGDGIITYLENGIIIIMHGWTLFKCLDLVILLGKKVE